MIQAAASVWRAPVFVTLLLACLGAWPPTAVRAAAPALNLTYPPPPILGSAALIYDEGTKRITFAVNQNTPLPMASTTKLMTALLVLEQGRLNTPTTVSANAATVGGSTMNLYAGEVLTRRDLLYGLLLPSGNDAAVALAESVGGTEGQFVAMMNARCARLGCTHTHFTSPHGLDMPGHYASARDLLRIVLADLHYATFRAIMGTRTYYIAPSSQNNPHYLVNLNEPLWWYPGVIGAKPGNTTNAGFCDVLVAKHGKHEVIVITLGMPDRYTDVRDLLNFAFSDFTWRSPESIPTSLENQMYPRDSFSLDSPYDYLIGKDAGGRPYRYYIGTGYYVQEPLLSYLGTHPGLGLPTSEAVTSGDLATQRFGPTVLIYHGRTATFSLES
ncbi:MAG TPA: D-alanyl-D-alanine carboxypeptidase family protein [Chloroflexota bacterium]|nr:D-alanyl-D-alanine carboxypeptidase family protein [Chloroflexota bacterium]